MIIKLNSIVFLESLSNFSFRKKSSAIRSNFSEPSKNFHFIGIPIGHDVSKYYIGISKNTYHSNGI